MQTQTHLPARKPLATFILCRSVSIIISLCKARLNHGTCQIGWSSDSFCFLTDQLWLSGERSLVMANYGKPALGRCLFLTLQCCLPKLLPVVTPLSSKTPGDASCCHTFQLTQIPARLVTIPRTEGKELTWGHNTVFANSCHSHWFTLGSEQILLIPISCN